MGYCVCGDHSIVNNVGGNVMDTGGDMNGQKGIYLR